MSVIEHLSVLPYRCFVVLTSLVALGVVGCSQGGAASHPLNEELARTSVEKAMQAWVDGKTPQDLQPDVVVGDSAWDEGQKLISFEVLRDEETTDGSNLHIRVLRKFQGAESKVNYIVGTTPVVTIFPQ